MNGALPDRTARRRAAYRRGHYAEWLALAALMLKGYWPIGRRVSIAGGEIDLVVQRWNTIVFVEVKARAKRDDARDAINAAKRRRFSRAVRAWIGRNGWCSGATFRADAVFVGAREWPAHVEQIFTIEGL
ncbi:putative endonuclease [Methylobacterium sp. UNC378MF]|jgi:putative endonuclease|uniref:YraN family protein n=1 Tax=Methylobacterium sp. UNC378MF TaxID=1502748 RepID=UPI00088A91C7|nr:YraN family protein [Methylobacterium sp. UNC378MF]SDA25993.1 putative endonuclease [Methylobacterium sp. UNC378MF]